MLEGHNKWCQHTVISWVAVDYCSKCPQDKKEK